MKKPALVLLGLFVATSASAALNQWVSVQPDGPDNALGGYIQDAGFGLNGGAYIRTSMGNVYTRPSAQATWQRASITVDGEVAQVWRIYTNRVDPLLLTASSSVGVIRTLDGGQSWSQLGDFSSFSSFGDLSISSTDPNLIYVRTSGIGLHRSTDGALTWTSVNALGLGPYYGPVRIDPFEPNALLTLDSSRIMKSTDGGDTWFRSDDGVSTAFWYMSDLTFDTTTPGIVYAASAGTTLISKSTDGGDNWSTVGVPLSQRTGPLKKILIDPSNSNVVYALGRAVYRTVDGGLNWTKFDNSADMGNWYQGAISESGEVLVGGSNGVAIPATGVALERSNAGLSDYQFITLQRAPSDHNYLYGSSFWGGMVAKPAGTDIWQSISNGIDADARGMAIDWSNPQRLLAATSRDGLVRSEDGGVSWQPMPMPDGSNITSGVSIAPSDANRVVLRTADGLFASSDGGLNWQQFLSGDAFTTGGVPYPLLFSPDDPDRFVAGAWNNGIYYTSDGGETWKQWMEPSEGAHIRDVAIHPQQPGTIIASAGNSTLWRTDDWGEKWEQVAPGLPASYTYRMALDPFDGDRIYVSRTQQVWVYDPDVSVWSSLAGLDQDAYCGESWCQLTTDPAHRGRIIVSTDRGLFEYRRDRDLDQLADDEDNCYVAANADQRDTDGDGLGNACDADIAPANNDCVVNVLDLAALRLAFLTAPGTDAWNDDADFNGDGRINAIDLGVLRSQFFHGPGPGAQINDCNASSP